MLEKKLKEMLQKANKIKQRVDEISKITDDEKRAKALGSIMEDLEKIVKRNN